MGKMNALIIVAYEDYLKFALCRQREQAGRSDSEEDEIATFESASLSEEEDVVTGGMVYLHVLLSLSFFFFFIS